MDSIYNRKKGNKEFTDEINGTVNNNSRFDNNIKGHSSARTTFVKTASIIYSSLNSLLPRKWRWNDLENGDEVIEKKMDAWWWIFGKKIFHSIIYSIVLISLVMVTINIKSFLMIKKEFNFITDSNGVIMENIKSTFTVYDDISKFSDVVSLFDVVIHDREIDSGYFESQVRDEGRKNISISSLSMELYNHCISKDCRCISSYHLGIPKNIIFVRLGAKEDNNGIFLINPVISDESNEKIRVFYQRNKFNHDDLHNINNWVWRPSYIIIEFSNFENKKVRKVLDQKSSVCVYECISTIEQKN